MGRMSNIPPRRFGSLAAAMVTPMTDTGEIDLPSAQRLATKLVDEGCDTILLSGTTGESVASVTARTCARRPSWEGRL